MKELINDIKKTIVFIGRFDLKNKVNFYGTGFLIQKEGVFYLVTAKHVIFDMRINKLADEETVIFFNSKEQKPIFKKISEIKSNFKLDWLFHKNPNVDVAVIPFGLDPEKDDVKVIDENQFLEFDRLFEIYDTFFLSFQPGINYNRITPIIRSGTISLLNDDKTFYIDASAFPGNSGSPVFLKPSPIRFDSGNISIGGDSLGGKFIGLIGEYIPYTEVAVSTQTGKPRVVFEENTGLSRVWSTHFIKEILDSENMKEQIKKLKETT